MEMLCIGMSHQTAPIELREKFAIPETEHGVQLQRVRVLPLLVLARV